MIIKLILGAILIILLSISLGWFIISVSKIEAKLNNRIDDLEKKAKLAESLSELEELNIEYLKLLSLCWHTIHCTRLSIINSLIQLKLNNINTKKSEFKFDFDL